MIKTKKILLVEDDSDDQFLFLDAISRLGSSVECDTVSNGKEALTYLKDNHSMPNAIFLDLNMPKMGGIEFLKILTKEEEYKDIPVIILTTSLNPVDINNARQLGAKSYLQKLSDYKGFIDQLKEVVNADFKLTAFPS